jgi:hypothetical protein
MGDCEYGGLSSPSGDIAEKFVRLVRINQRGTERNSTHCHGFRVCKIGRVLVFSILIFAQIKESTSSVPYDVRFEAPEYAEQHFHTVYSDVWRYIPIPP